MNLNAFGGTRLLSDTFLYGIANIFSEIVSFNSLFLSKNLTVENYGIVDFILSLVALSSIIVIFGQDYAIARYFNQEEDNNKKKIIISAIINNTFTSNNFIFTNHFINSFLFKEKFFLKEYDLSLIILALLSVFSLVIINFCQTVIKYSFQRTKFILISFAQGFLFF